MFTFLDLLVVVFMALAACSVLSLGLMFLLRNEKAKKVCFYVVVALGLYTAYIGFYIGLGGMFTGQVIFSALTLLMAVASVVLERMSKKDPKWFKIARILAMVMLVIGFSNALLF